MNTDQIYIDTLKDQIKSGIYDHLFEGKSDLVFLDIGANIGLVSIYAVPYCKRIVSLEPCQSTYDRLKDNTRIYPMIETVQAALTPQSGPHEFFVNDINFTASSTVNTYGQRIEVQGKTLGTILKENNLTHVDVCKCDAEGAEGEALSCSEILNAREIIQQWFIEVHNCPKTDWYHKLGTLVGNLARCGYSEMKISGMSITATRP
jgi:FkbM family methyltransferase